MTSTCGLVARFITLIPSYCDNATIVCGLVTKFDSRVLRCCGLLTRLSEQVTKSVVVMPRNDHFFDHLPGRIPGHVTKKNNQMPRSCKKIIFCGHLIDKYSHLTIFLVRKPQVLIT